MPNIRRCSSCDKPYRASHGNSKHCKTCVLDIKSQSSSDYFQDQQEKKVYDPLDVLVGLVDG